MAEVTLVGRADEDSEPELQRGGGDDEVVRRDQPAGSAEHGEELGPALGDLAPELDERHPGDERVDLGAPGRRSRRGIRELHAGEQFGVDDRREGNLLGSQLGR